MDTGPRPSVTILDGSHELTLLDLRREEESFTLAYTVTPALPEDPDGASLLLMLEARDDLGNEYTDWGGAFGTARNGSATEGEISGRPALPDAATSLSVTFTYLREGEEMPYELTVPLGPCPAS